MCVSATGARTEKSKKSNLAVVVGTVLGVAVLIVKQGLMRLVCVCFSDWSSYREKQSSGGGGHSVGGRCTDCLPHCTGCHHVQVCFHRFLEKLFEIYCFTYSYIYFLFLCSPYFAYF